MLEPTQRQHFLQALSPPEGYELSFAIGTTYSLDLMTLLSVPLAFARFDWEDDAGRPVAEPLALLEAVRRYADRLHIFFQAGGIAVPSKNQLLFGYLESCVFQVQAPLGGVFHPKVWVLRFSAPDQPVIYRLLCLSRNLTFDCSWDTILTLEGEVIERQKAFTSNHPLGDFIESLPSLVANSLPEHVLKNFEQAQYELRRVNFVLPQGFDEYRFWPMGIKGYSHQNPLKGRIQRLLVVSPFLSTETLQNLTSQGTDHILMSRLDSLVALPKEDLAGFKKLFTLNPMAEIEETNSQTSEPLFPEATLSGLHVKLFVADDGRRAHIWTGSANATQAAFHRNVEFLLELTGPKSFCGVDVFLESVKEQSKFIDLWLPFTPNSDSILIDPVKQQLELALRLTQTAIVTTRWHSQVHSTPDNQTYILEVTPEGDCAIAPQTEVRYWPLTLPPSAASQPSMDRVAGTSFGPMACESLSAFIVFHITAKSAERSMSVQFVLHVPLSGAPADRQDRLLRAMLRDRDQVLRFLLFILADGKNDLSAPADIFLDPTQSASNTSTSNSSMENPLFEALVQTLHHDPFRLDQIARTVTDLERTAEGRQLLPTGFYAIWTPIWEARQRLRP